MQRETKSSHSKIAACSCNFGGYRNEIENGIDDFYIDEKIDCYFYTDDRTLRSKRWNIIFFPTEQKTEHLDPNRYANKFVKFKIPKELKKYEIIIWIDSKNLNEQFFQINKERKMMTYDEIIEKMNTYYILHERHPFRDTVHDEIKITIRCKKERKNKGQLYMKYIEDKTHRSPLMELGYFIWKNIPKVKRLLRKTFSDLIKHELRRDQLIYPFTLDATNFPLEKISFCL
jgi:hypothetical protein